MIQESSENKKADEERRRYYEHASRAEILCTDADNAITQYGKFMEESEKESVRQHIVVVKTMIDDIRSGKTLHSPKELNKKVNEMQNQCMEVIKTLLLDNKQAKINR